MPGIKPQQSRRIILPGEVAQRRAGLTIYVPRGHEVDPPSITGVCNFCGARFERKGEEAAWEQHTARCGQKHLDDIRAMAPSEVNRGTIWDENSWDPEVAEHMRKVGRRMRAEGRLETHPSERAGL